jgi:hypothetical protein
MEIEGLEQEQLELQHAAAHRENLMIKQALCVKSVPFNVQHVSEIRIIVQPVKVIEELVF